MLFPWKLSLIVTPTNHIITLALVYFHLARSDVSYRRYLQLAVCSPNMVLFVNSNYIINAPIRDKYEEDHFKRVYRFMTC